MVLADQYRPAEEPENVDSWGHHHAPVGVERFTTQNRLLQLIVDKVIGNASLFTSLRLLIQPFCSLSQCYEKGFVVARSISPPTNRQLKPPTLKVQVSIALADDDIKKCAAALKVSGTPRIVIRSNPNIQFVLELSRSPPLQHSQSSIKCILHKF